MKIYFNTYKINPSKSSSLINDNNKQQQQQQEKMEPSNFFINTFDPDFIAQNEPATYVDNNTENDVDMDLKKKHHDSLANQFHEFIESKEDFLSKQKLKTSEDGISK